MGIVVALVVSLMLTLFARLYYVQLLDPNKPTQTAHAVHDGAIVLPAPRGLIVDAQGRVLVANTTVQTVTVTRDILQRRPDHGAAVLARLATLLGTKASLLAKQITPCSPKVTAPCSTGQPYAPVTVASKVPTKVVLAISEHREQFPGVSVDTVSLPTYPGGSLAAQVLGYTSDVTAADVKANRDLNDADTIGAGGLEQQYDSVLRGTDGTQYVQLNPQGITVGSGKKVAAQQGDTLVTSIDAHLQALAESSLARQIRDSRKAGNAAPSGSVVIMDPNTGRILASASYPTYDPSVFVGGISAQDYRTLTSDASGTPLINRATAGEYAPGSTFKLITSSSLVTHHEISLGQTYGCPGSLTIDGRVKTNYDSEVLGNITLRDALGYSCDTFFYRPTANEYYADQARLAEGKPVHEYLQRMAAQFGVGRSPGVDLPAGEQSTGSYADRETRLKRWKANRATYCANAKRGYPDVKNPTDRAYLTLLASENCTDGWRYRAGDNADMSIGQGETTMSPLQLAMAYSALLNGGKIYEPTFGWGVVGANGKVVKTITPKVRNTVPVSQKTFNYIANSLSFSRGWAVSGAFAYMHSPYQNKLGGKTGTAEVFGKQDSSWLVSWGPTYKDRSGNVRAHYVMAGIIEQAGTGATAAGPMEKRIWDGIFGVGQAPVIPGITPETTLPSITPQSAVTHK
ncbi:penicillin-binding transpeptidase domain-containing protein [uncultured Jatrophihabitans sp.]|uniref:penicillin-binding transpeptidase domain-containing protein n=1 Tax=uncultured Jatrophihabitans sp. TaxID=1610747 RepID=UPI0035CAE54A